MVIEVDAHYRRSLKTKTIRVLVFVPLSFTQTPITIMSIKPTQVHEGMCIYYTTNVISLLHVSATYCAHLQGGIFRRILQKTSKPIYKYKILSFWCKGYNVLKYNFIVILYFNTF
jgi:hypothetical protein